MPLTRVCLAGVTGWVGRALVAALTRRADFMLTGAVARTEAGRLIREVLPGVALPAPAHDIVIRRSVAEALDAGADVLIDYTSPDAVKANVMQAIGRGVAVVIGTSGLDDSDFAEIDAAAHAAGVGVVAGANFALTAVVAEHLAMIAARVLSTWEIIDYAAAGKPDAPSGTARQLAHRLAHVGRNEIEIPIDKTFGSPGARGLTLGGAQIHSVRVPGHTIGVEVLFGRENERLSVRYDGGSDAGPYVGGTLLAAKHVTTIVGLQRGLTRVVGLE